MSDDERTKPLLYLFGIGTKVQFKPRRIPKATEGAIAEQTIILDDFVACRAYVIDTDAGRIKVREHDIIGAPEKEEA